MKVHPLSKMIEEFLWWADKKVIFLLISATSHEMGKIAEQGENYHLSLESKAKKKEKH